MAKEKGVGIIAKIPLDSGWLSGKYNAESTFQDIRKRWLKEEIQTRAHLVDRVKEIVQAEDNLAQKAISFCWGHKAISTVIPRNINIAQLKTNLESINDPVSTEIIIKLEEFYLNEVQPLHLPW